MEFKTYSHVKTGMGYSVTLKDGSSVHLSNHVFKGMEDGHYVFLDLASRSDFLEAGHLYDDNSVEEQAEAIGIPFTPDPDKPVVHSNYNGQRWTVDEVDAIDFHEESIDWLVGASADVFASTVETL